MIARVNFDMVDATQLRIHSRNAVITVMTSRNNSSVTANAAIKAQTAIACNARSAHLKRWRIGPWWYRLLMWAQRNNQIES